MKNLKVQVQFECEECNGSGIVENAIWTEYNKAVLDGEIDGRDYVEVEKWFIANGFDINESEEIDCHECKGSGLDYKYISIKELLSHADKYNLLS